MTLHGLYLPLTPVSCSHLPLHDRPVFQPAAFPSGRGLHLNRRCPCAGLPLGVVLNFLLQLGFREAGSALALASLDDAQRAISADMSQLGLLMPFRWAASVH